MGEFEKNLKEAIKHLQIADHITYITFPLINEKKLLLKIFEEIYFSVINCINAVFDYEYSLKHSNFDYEEKLESFIEKISKKYDLSQNHLKKIKEIIEIKERYNESAMEFVRKDKLIIMSGSLKTQVLDINLIKNYLLTAKELLMKVNSKIKKTKGTTP